MKIKICALLILGLVFLSPVIYSQYIHLKDNFTQPLVGQFPVTVDSVNEVIVEDERVDAYFENLSSSYSLSSTIFSSFNKLDEVLSTLVISISEISGGRTLALVSGETLVRIPAGLRKEEIVELFAKALKWSEEEKKIFLTPQDGQELPLSEGSFSPGIYTVGLRSTPQEVQSLVNRRFQDNVLARYSTSTAKLVPLKTALTIASLIQRETLETDDMRLVSGIIWNRIFADMNLQLDATLQYSKNAGKQVAPWWPKVRSQDKFIKSPYNTYMYKGLPPSPIANPSVVAIIAALNPLKTACLFYFHDRKGDMHCTATYKEHVSLLKKYYGRGS